MPEQIFIQVRFTEPTEVGEYSDALYFTQAEYATLQQIDIDALKKSRIDSWVNQIKNPPIVAAPKEADIQQALIDVENNKLSLDLQATELSAQLTALQTINVDPIKIG